MDFSKKKMLYGIIVVAMLIFIQPAYSSSYYSCTQHQTGTPFSCQPGESYSCSSANNMLSCLSDYRQCSDGIDNDGDGLIDSADPGCHNDFNANNPASYDSSISHEYNVITKTYQCSDGIDNDGDGKIDFPDDPGCSDIFDNEAKPWKDNKVVLVDCKGDCRTKGWSPDSICQTQLGSEWHAISVNCDDLDAEGDITFSLRNLSAIWTSTSWGWCKDTAHDDMTVSCTKKTQNVKAVLIDCKGTCQQIGFSPESVCQSQVGSSWHAFSVDCEAVQFLNQNNSIVSVTRDLSMLWSGNDAFGQSIGWCADTNGIDMVVYCTDVPPYGSDIKLNVKDCKGDCRTSGLSPDKECASFGNDWHATTVNCEGVDADGDITFAKRALTQTWNAVSVGWCLDTPDADMSTTCEYFTPPSRPPKPQCSDGIDNDGDGKIDFPADRGCSDKFDNNEIDIPKDNKVVLVDCKGECRTKGWSPDSICQTQLGSEWHAISVNCDDLDAEGDITFSLRNLSAIWTSTSWGWCKDTAHDDMTVSCTKKTQNVKAVLIDCKGTCQQIGFSPESVCQSQVGSSWHAFSVDCQAVQILNQVNSAVIRDLSMQWGGFDAFGQSIGWCADTSADDMTVYCTDVPPYSSDLKVIVQDCGGDCRTKGWSPNSICQDNLGNSWLAFSVNCESIDAEGNIYYDTKVLDQTWSSEYVGWCKDTPDADMTITCYLDRKKTTYSCLPTYLPSCSSNTLSCTKTVNNICRSSVPSYPPYTNCVATGSCGGGGGCPTLFTYDGKDYVKERKSNIHSQPGIDTVDDITLTTKPVVVDGNYLLQLKETTLPEHSYIDSVRLFITDSEGKKEAKLVSAKHSKYGDVINAIAKSDDIRTDTQVFDTIDLKFKVPELKGEANFTFEIEGYNPAVNILDKGVSIIGQVIMSGNIITKFDIADFTVIAAIIAIAISIVLIYGSFKFFAGRNDRIR